MLQAIWIVAISNDIAVAVDGLGGSERPTGVGRDKAVEVSHYPIAVEEGMIGECVAGRRDPHDLVSVADFEGVAIRPTKRAQVAHLPTAVEKGMNGSVVAGIRGPNFLVGVVDVAGKTL